MIIITGLGRCGTSLLAKYLTTLGKVTGGRWVDKYNAGYEDPKFVSINERIIRGEIVPKEDFEYTREAVKDPRLTYFGAKALKRWLSERNDLKVILMTRKLQDSYNSRKLTIGDDWLPNELIEWELDLFETKDVIKEIDHCILPFPEIVENYDLVHEGLKKVGVEIDYKVGEKIWKQIADIKKVKYV